VCTATYRDDTGVSIGCDYPTTGSFGGIALCRSSGTLLTPNKNLAKELAASIGQVFSNLKNIALNQFGNVISFIKSSIFSTVNASGQGPGFINITNNSSSVTGSGTTFTTTFQVGDNITALFFSATGTSQESHTIKTIISDTSLTTTSNWTRTATNLIYIPNIYVPGIFYTYKWYKNGTLQSALTVTDTTETSTTLPSTYLTSGATWKCEVTPLVRAGYYEKQYHALHPSDSATADWTRFQGTAGSKTVTVQ
jgi:hypothetical protein